MSIRVGINGFGRMGRLIGTVLSGWVFQVAGLVACLCISTAFVAAAALI